MVRNSTATTSSDARPRARPLTEPQRRLLKFIAANSGKLYGSRRDIPKSIARRNVLDNIRSAGLVRPPVQTPTRTWELTDAGRLALSDGASRQDDAPEPNGTDND
jgi:hypothetical protein